MTKAVQHSEKAEKRCFVCDDPSHFTRDCPQWEEFCHWNLNRSERSGMKGVQASLPKKND